MRINFTSPETRVIILPDTENYTIIWSFFWTKHRNVTDKQTESSVYSVCSNRVRCTLIKQALRIKRHSTKCFTFLTDLRFTDFHLQYISFISEILNLFKHLLYELDMHST